MRDVTHWERALVLQDQGDEDRLAVSHCVRREDRGSTAVSARLWEVGAPQHYHAERVLPWGHLFGLVMFFLVAMV